MRLRSVIVLVVIAACSRSETRFAWLSDTHVGGSTGATDLREVVADINARKAVDFVLLTGDITEFGSDKQLWEAKGILDRLSVPYHIIPGNHDLKWSESGGVTFSRLWGPGRFAFEAGGYRIIGLHQGPRMRMAEGHFAPDDIRWLDSVLAKDRALERPFLFATHYPLDSSISNWYEVLDRLKRVDTRMVFVGHGHRNRVDSYEGLPGLMGRSILGSRSISAGYNVVDLRDDSIFVEEHTIADHGVNMWYMAPIRAVMNIAATDHWPRPDYSANREFPNVSILWTFKADATVASSAAVGEDRVIVGDASGTVFGIDLKSGRPLWTFKTGGPVYSSPGISGGMVVFGSADGSIYCLNARDGGERWQVRTGRAVLGCPTILDGRVFIGGSDSCMRALDLNSGAVIWKSPSIGGFVETRPAATQEKVFFGAWDGAFYALNASSGALAWRWSGEKPGILYSPAACWPALGKGKVFIVAPDRYLTVLDEATGKELFRTNRYPVRESIGISSNGARVYMRTLQDTIVALRTDENPPPVSWIASLSFGYDINAAMLVERGAVLYYATQRGFVYALNAATGERLWTRRICAVPINTITPLEDGRIIATDFDGKIRCIGSTQ